MYRALSVHGPPDLKNVFDPLQALVKRRFVKTGHLNVVGKWILEKSRRIRRDWRELEVERAPVKVSK